MRVPEFLMQWNHFSFTQSFQIPGLGIVKGANRKKLDLPVQTAEGIGHRCIVAKSLETAYVPSSVAQADDWTKCKKCSANHKGSHK